MPEEINNIPPKGDSKKAEKYLNQLIDLVSKDKLKVTHTDLAKFDPSNLQDHYRVELKDYHTEISHSKKPDSGEDSYIMLFTNIKMISGGCTEKVILAFMQLSADQYLKFKQMAAEQLNREEVRAQEKRFNEAMEPVQKALDEVANQSEVVEQETAHG